MRISYPFFSITDSSIGWIACHNDLQQCGDDFDTHRNHQQHNRLRLKHKLNRNILYRRQMLVKLLSWNVNGLRALLKKPEWNWLVNSDAQIVGLQETKASTNQLPDDVACLPGWHCYWDSSTVKKGYSGVSVFSRLEPQNAIAELPDARFQGEGRLLHLEFPQFHFFNGYFPNGGAAELDENGKPTGKYKRVPYKLGFFDVFLNLAIELEKTKPVIVCGDFNIAHNDIDLARPKENSNVSGFLPEEREVLNRFSKVGFVDSFRSIHGNKPDMYTWWSYQRNARQRNVGWRIDYFFVSRKLAAKIRDAQIHNEIEGSDHCPISLVVEV